MFYHLGWTKIKGAMFLAKKILQKNKHEKQFWEGCTKIKGVQNVICVEPNVNENFKYLSYE